VPSVVRAFAALAGLDGAAARAIFNGGIGMVAIVERAAVEPVLEFLACRRLVGSLIGDVVERGNGPAYFEEAFN